MSELKMSYPHVLLCTLNIADNIISVIIYASEF